MAKHRTRSNSRYSRNPIVKFFNPFGGGVVRKITHTAKETLSFGNAKKAGAIVATIAAGFSLPAKFLPQHNSGVKGILLTIGSGILATIAVGFAAPAFVPSMIVGSLAAGLLKAGFMYARGAFTGSPLAGFDGFLTSGNIDNRLLQNKLNGLGAFLETRVPVASMGPTSSLTLGGGERFSQVT